MPAEGDTSPERSGARPAQRARSVRSHGALLLFSSALLAPAFVALFVPGATMAERLQACAFSVLIWVLWLALWGRAYRACIVAAPVLLLVPVALYLRIAYHSPLTPAVIGVIAETNAEESSQFLRGLWLPICAVYGMLGLLALLSLRSMHRHELRWQHWTRALILIVLPCAWAGAFVWYQRQAFVSEAHRYIPDPFRIAPWPAAVEKLRDTFPLGLGLQFQDYLAGERNIARADRVLAGFHFGARQLSVVSSPQVYVLIIGESARRDRWSLYGYARKTSPNLERQKNLVRYDDVVTIGTATRLSVPMMLTRKPVERALYPVYSERSFLTAFKEAGFSTYWYSNQAPVGLFDAPIAMYAKEADHLAYFNKSGGLGVTPPDGVLIEALKRALASATESRQLIVLHTLGSHFDYRYRYPHDFDVFKPSPSAADAASLHDDEFQIKVSNAYDNSILYTDYFISQVIAAVQASNRPIATVMYLSDHGEDLFDSRCGNTGHGRSTPAAYRIPFLFWYSSDYERLFPQKVAWLVKHRQAPITTQSVFPTLLESADIHFAGEDLSRSVMSPTFRTFPRTVITSNRSLDFDRAHLNSSCELQQ